MIKAVMQETHQLMFRQRSAGTGKTFMVKIVISPLEYCGKNCLICGTTGIATAQYRGGRTLHSLFHLGIDEQFAGSLRSNIGRGIIQDEHILNADLIMINEVSMLIPWVANRVSMTLQSIFDGDCIEFGRKQVLFVGDLLQLPPVVADMSMPGIYRLITRLPY
jgi:hypothetical protein